MGNMVEYLRWRGDIRFSQMPPNPVDMLIFSILSYIRLSGIVSEDLRLSAPLRNVAKTFLALSDDGKRQPAQRLAETSESGGLSEGLAHG